MTDQDSGSGSILIPDDQLRIRDKLNRVLGGSPIPQRAALQLLRYAIELAMATGVNLQEHFNAYNTSLNITRARRSLMPTDLALGMVAYGLMTTAQAIGTTHEQVLKDALKIVETLPDSELKEEWEKLTRGME